LASSKRAVLTNKVQIKQDWCKGCGICAAFCPRGALSLGSRGKAELDTPKCSGCGICEMFCPDFALVLQEEGVRECLK
jgi:2-oxoglutarate ferredoxin oxidoreductase subunit delta